MKAVNVSETISLERQTPSINPAMAVATCIIKTIDSKIAYWNHWIVRLCYFDEMFFFVYRVDENGAFATAYKYSEYWDYEQETSSRNPQCWEDWDAIMIG